MTARISLIFIIIIFSSNVSSTNIRELDFQTIINNNINISLIYDKINKDQIIHKDKFKNEELILQTELARIDKLNLILDPSELDKEINKYNQQLGKFNNKIEEFNLHYEKQINSLKNIIINLILEELKKYSEVNKIDLILDSENYILSSKAINITDIIENQVNQKIIEFNFEKY